MLLQRDIVTRRARRNVQETLLGILDGYQEWRDNMPAGVSDSATAQRLDDLLALRDLVEQLQGVDLPKGFGRD